MPDEVKAPEPKEAENQATESQGAESQESMPAWATDLTATMESMKTVINEQKALIEQQQTQMAEMKESFKSQTANLIQHGGITIGSAQSQSDGSPVNAALQPPSVSYTPLRDLDFLPQNFREGKSKYISS